MEMSLKHCFTPTDMHGDDKDLVVDAESGSHLVETSQGSTKIDSPWR